MQTHLKKTVHAFATTLNVSRLQFRMFMYNSIIKQICINLKSPHFCTFGKKKKRGECRYFVLNK